MERTGVVVSDMGQFSKIKLLRHTACGNCGACQLGDDSKDIHLIAQNKLGAHVGDMVEVAMASKGVLSAAFIMYVLPLAGLFIGLTIGYVLFGTHAMGEVFTALLGFALMAAVFIVIKRNNQRFLNDDKYTAKITQVVQHAHDDLIPLS